MSIWVLEAQPPTKKLVMRCDGYGILQTKRSAIFFLNLKIKDPESFAAKIIVEYNSSAVSQVHMPISAP